MAKEGGLEATASLGPRPSGRIEFWLAVLGFLTTLAALALVDWLVEFLTEPHYRDLATLLIAFTCLIFVAGLSAVGFQLVATQEWRSLADSRPRLRAPRVAVTGLVVGLLGSAIFTALNIPGLYDADMGIRFGARALLVAGVAVLLLHAVGIFGIAARKPWGRIAAGVSLFYWLASIILLIPGALLLWSLWRSPVADVPS